MNPFEGGPFNRLMAWMGLGGCARRQVFKRVSFWVAVSWLPIFVLGIIGGLTSLNPPRVNTFNDITVYARCFVAIPVLFAAECNIRQRISQVTPIILDRDLIRSEALPAFKRLDSKIQGIQDSNGFELLLLLVTLLVVATRFYPELPEGVTSWRHFDNFYIVWAREWDRWIGLSLYYFLILRWISIFLLWCFSLLRVAMLNPHLQSHHPDEAGGLSFLVHRHLRFGILAFVLSSVIAAKIAESVVHGGAKVDQFLLPMLFYLVTAEFLIILPLLAFTPNLVKVRWKGLDLYGTFANRYAEDFDQKWLTSNVKEIPEILGTPDLQSLNDLDGSYVHQSEMGVVLMKRRHFVALTALVGSPLFPLVLFKVPLGEIFKVLAKLIA